jgi:cytochrome P450
MWGIFQYADCLSVLKDPRLSTKRAGAMLRNLPEDRRAEFAELAHLLGLWMLFMDAPEHTRLRKLMNKGFTPAAAETLRP